MKKLLTCITTILFCIQSFSSDIKSYKPRKYNAFQPKLQYEYHGLHNISLGIANIYYEGESTDLPWWYHGPFLDAGIAFDNNTTLLTNKIGYEYFLLILGARVNLVHYTDFSKRRMDLRPELGLTFFSHVTLTYGYNFQLQNDNVFDLNRHVITLNVGLLRDK